MPGYLITARSSPSSKAVVRVDGSGELHFIRDTCYREDPYRVYTHSGPRLLVSRTDITEATR